MSKLYFLLLELSVTTSCKVADDNGLHKQHNGLKGKHLQIVTGHFPPPIEVLRNSSGHVVGFSGMLYHHLLFLSQKLNFRYNIFPAAENTNGVEVNGTWNGIIGELLRQEADIGLAPVDISLQRYEALDFRGRIGGDWTSILYARLIFQRAYMRDSFHQVIYDVACDGLVLPNI
ncbi:hypothetical protein OUZ56_006698 [Daphnia magna]|uniref:Ionotropic glutamate receptor L-glutamate and glycine-binding domain-containing protein n=1 Tax=Daphnia magna TaxID=35525 RepID=A0ABQ9YWE8_9CRUS|nr:hypothetical protein OUZ56_006698 [Daphnia magna]